MSTVVLGNQIQIMANQLSKNIFDLYSVFFRLSDIDPSIKLDLFQEPLQKFLVSFKRKQSISISESMKTVLALKNSDYTFLVNLLKYVYSCGDLKLSLHLISEMEQSFNLSRLVLDKLTKIKVEDFQDNLLTIKNLLRKSILNPSDKSLKESISSNFAELISKFETSEYTIEVLRNLGLNSDYITSSLSVTHNKDGSIDLTWKKSS